MAETITRKMPKPKRREQLLEVAHAIARDEGTDALTLGRLAEKAGVSKPIAYEHFQSRSGLMIALYNRINERQVRLLETALAQTPARLDDVAEVMATTYMDCCKAVGPEWHAIVAALRGDSEMDAYQQNLIDSYVDFYGAALRPFAALSDVVLRQRCVAIVGAADAISREMLRGRVTEPTAAADLKSLIVGWVLHA
jgi:AcrR family transcriptional regulator